MNVSGTHSTPPLSETRESKESETRKVEGYEMLIGNAMDTEEARNQWIDTVEKLLELESLERGQQHLQKNFDHAPTHNEEPYKMP